jgi:hypothetical protein
MLSGNGQEETRNVKADINMLSYYKQARNAADEIATHEGKLSYMTVVYPIFTSSSLFPPPKNKKPTPRLRCRDEQA